jgi:7-cyano-7-deazaguanine synthase
VTEYIVTTDYTLASLVLLSGGLDSAVLVASEARASRVFPVYVSVGLAWEPRERQILARLLATPPYATNVAPLAELTFDMRDVYAPTHWAITGHPPAYDTPDEDVYLVGRNLVLLTKAGVMAATKRVTRIALGPLAGNPFPDARPAFFETMGRALSLGLDRGIEIVTPFARMHKEEVIRLGAELGVPFELTLSCMNPQDGGDVPLHCGLCSKCRERRDAFAAAKVEDPTPYAAASPR